MELTLEEKCRLVSGQGMWHTWNANGKLASIKLSDGPHGLRTQEDGAKNNDSHQSTCFPTASCVACSWDKELVGKMGEAIAKEAKAEGVSIVLGPGINIKRSPLCGRNFEYYSEDPFLAGSLGSGFVEAVQKQGVGTSLKHFAGNSQETHRMTANSMIDERTLREIYLSAFEMVVKRSAPATIMASYNRVNGKNSCENRHLLTEILRDEWKYRGLVVSDWGACVDLPACIEAGMDLEMPDSLGNHRDSLLESVRNGQTSMEALDRAVDAVTGLVKNYKTTRVPQGISRELQKENHRLASQIAVESAVLLKNDNFFPIKKGSKVLIIGGMAENIRYQGGGSSHINSTYVSDLFKCFKKCGLKTMYVKGYDSRENNPDYELEQEALQNVKMAAKENIPVLFFGGLTDKFEGEGYDRTSFAFPQNQRELLQKILKNYENVGFISFGGAPYNMDLPMKAKGLLHMYLGGQGVAAAVAKLVAGQANPCGKLAETIPYFMEDAPCHGLFARQGEQLDHIEDVPYREMQFVGYRYYDSFDVPVRFPFGFGLSYTSFEYSQLKVKKQEDEILVKVNVTNTGKRKGKEIVQLYVKNPKCDFMRANRQLQGFAKVELEPKETKTVEIRIDSRAFMVYKDQTMRIVDSSKETETDNAGNGFVTVAGSYEIQIGASIKDIRLSKSIDIKGCHIEKAMDLGERIPLSKENFEKLYSTEYEIEDYTHTRAGDYSAKNSLNQLAKVSKTGKLLLGVGKVAGKAMMFPKSKDDPEVKMMVETIVDGNIDTFCNQSGGLIKARWVDKVIEEANRNS